MESFLRDILLTDHMLSVFDLFWITCYEDTSTLAATVWLADECSVLPPASVGLEVSIVSWQAPRTGKNIVLLGEEFEHAVKVASQQVLTADLYHARKMVDFLKPFHFHDTFQRD